MEPKTFERALHCWDEWLQSVAEGRKLLRDRRVPPQLEEMRAIARKTITGLHLPSCSVFELYWLCCIFSDYDAHYAQRKWKQFRFEELVLPDWFPLPFGLVGRHAREGEDVQFKGRRIRPPEVWTEADREWRVRDGSTRYGLPRQMGERMVSDYLADWAIILPGDHPIHRFVNRGRPITTAENGLTRLEG